MLLRALISMTGSRPPSRVVIASTPTRPWKPSAASRAPSSAALDLSGVPGGDARGHPVPLVHPLLGDRLLDEVEAHRAVAADGEVVVEVGVLVGPLLDHHGQPRIAGAFGAPRDHAHQLLEPARLVDHDDALAGDAERVLDA